MLCDKDNDSYTNVTVLGLLCTDDQAMYYLQHSHDLSTHLQRRCEMAEEHYDER